jgi:hypothetical protein
LFTQKQSLVNLTFHFELVCSKLCGGMDIAFEIATRPFTFEMASQESPLIELAMSWIMKGTANPPPADSEPFIRSVVARFCREQINVVVCKAALRSIIPSMQPIDRISAILRCPPLALLPGPIPPYGRYVFRGHSAHWFPPEDNRLIAAVHRFGTHDWAAVAAFVGHDRSRAQCAQRWFRGLDPRISKELWSHEEDERLMRLVAGRKHQAWTWISAQMGNRSDVQCRYRYIQLQRDRGEIPHPSVEPDDTGERILPKKKGRPLKIDLVPLDIPPARDPAIMPPPREADRLLDWTEAVTDDSTDLCW